MGSVIKGPWKTKHMGVMQWRREKAELLQHYERAGDRNREVAEAATVLLIEATHGMVSERTLDEMANVLAGHDRYEPGLARIYGVDVDRLRFARARVFLPLLMEGACAAVSDLPEDSEARGLLLEAIDRAIPNDEDEDSRTPPNWRRTPRDR